MQTAERPRAGITERVLGWWLTVRAWLEMVSLVLASFAVAAELAWGATAAAR